MDFNSKFVNHLKNAFCIFCFQPKFRRFYLVLAKRAILQARDLNKNLLQVVEPRLPVPTQADHLVVVQVDNLFGVFNDGRGIRGQEVFPLAYAYEQRAGFTGRHDGVRIVLLDNGNGVRAHHLGQGQLHRVKQIGLPS